MSNTTNYNLNKPTYGTRNWDIPLNQNFDVIDSTMKEIDDKIGNLANSTATDKSSIINITNEINSNLNSHLTETVQRQDDPHGVYTEIFVRGVNPKWFGAVGDGIVDDTVALQNAINATPVNGILYAPDKYLITDTLYFNKDILYTGKGTIIKGFDTTSPMIRFYRGQIRDLIFIGNGNTQGHCINLQNNADGTKMEISNCIFLNIPGSAILGSSEETTVSINCNIHDNYIYNCGSGSAAVSPFTSAIRIANMSKIKVINNRINGNGNTYKGIDFSVGGSYCDISHNIVENCRYIGIGIAGQRYFKVNNNIVSTTVDNCIDINGCLYGTVNNNVIEAGKDGIFIGHNGVDNINVTGNEIQGCQQGIRIWDGAKNVLISSNKINNCSNQGIRASGTDGTTENLLNNIAIVDNMIQFATAAVGILIEGCYNIHCNNNSIKRITKGIDIKIITSSIYYGNVSHNTLLECSEYGINVGAGVNRLLLATNMIYGVSGNIYAINFAGSNSKLYYNMLEGTNNTINNTGVNNTVL
jgi:parallel beta-helix repeat protein